MKARLIFLLIQATLVAYFVGGIKGAWVSWTDGH